ncbi:MAG TPA: SDR family oxidoreductase [Solirubrobacteraceae bacterium]|nr:SDR family oxidoreductase [Solirubrobacteraceae bacterium]
MTVLVTGAAGFIGSNLVDRLLSAGYEVRALDNFSTGHRGNVQHVAGDIEIVEGDLRSYERVSRAVRGCDAVFHQGAMPSVPRSVQDPLTSSETNVGGTLNVLLAARDAGVRRVVFASSSSVYGDAPGFPRVETQATSPLAPYAVSKLAAEQYCRVAHLVYGLETVCLRYFNVFGRRQDPFSQYSAVIPKFIVSMRDGVCPTIYGDGTQSRDFTHVDDVVEANLLALDAPAAAAAGRIYNIARGRQVSLNDLVAELNAVLGSDLGAQHLPPRPGDVKHSLADVTRAEHELGFRASVELHEGLRRTIEDLQLSERASSEV